MGDVFKREKLFLRLKAISNKAPKLQRAIEDDMVEFCEAAGKHMSEICAVIKLQREVWDAQFKKNLLSDI